LWEYNFFSIGTWKQKLCPNKLKTGVTGQQNKNSKFHKKILLLGLPCFELIWA